MLREAKRFLPVSGTEWDETIAHLCKAAAMDLTARGVILPGTVEFVVTDTPVVDEHGNPVIDPDTGLQEQTVVVTDLSTLDDELCVMAICTYVKANLGIAPNYEQLRASYDEQKATLMMTDGYTRWTGTVTDDDDTE